MKLFLLLVLTTVAMAAPGVVGDFDNSGTPDFKDFASLAANWGSTGVGELDGVGVIDYNDLAIFVQHWLETEQFFCGTLPAKATTPSPINHKDPVSTGTTLTWAVEDCNQEVTTNDVWFGTTTLTRVMVASATHSYTPTLTTNTTYHWRVDTVNNKGVTEGDAWDFKTALSAPPVAQDQTVTATAYVVCPITLVATDDGFPTPPGKLKYEITTLPADTTAYLQDPVSGGQKKILSSNLPYHISSWSNVILFASPTTGSTSFKFIACDGEQHCSQKTITVNVGANPQDCLSFDGKGGVTVTNNANFDLVNLRGIALFINTHNPSGKVLGKYTPGSAGYELWLQAGIPQVKLYDSTGLVKKVNGIRRVADGTYHNIGFAYDSSGLLVIDDSNEGGVVAGSVTNTTGWVTVPVRTYSNSANFVVGDTYKGEIDNIRSYSFTEYTEDNFYFYYGYVTQSRTTAGNLNSIFGITLNPASSVRFKCDYNGTTNTTTQIYDDQSNHYVGTFSAAHVRYYPWTWQFVDVSAIQQGVGW